MELKNVMSKGRNYIESDVDGAIIELNPDYGALRSYFIDELSEQMGMYHIEDKKLTTDHVMTLTMGVSFITRKVSKNTKTVNLNPLASYNAGIRQNPTSRH